MKKRFSAECEKAGKRESDVLRKLVELWVVQQESKNGEK